MGEVLRDSSLGQCLLAEGRRCEMHSGDTAVQLDDETRVLEELQRFADGHLEL